MRWPATILRFQNDLRPTDLPERRKGLELVSPVTPGFIGSPSEEGEWSLGSASRVAGQYVDDAGTHFLGNCSAWMWKAGMSTSRHTHRDRQGTEICISTKDD